MSQQEPEEMAFAERCSLGGGAPQESEPPSSSSCCSLPRSCSDLHSSWDSEDSFCRQTSSCSLKSEDDICAPAPSDRSPGGLLSCDEDCLFDEPAEPVSERYATASAPSYFHQADIEEQILVQLAKEAELGTPSPAPIPAEHRQILMQWIKQVCVVRALSPATMFLAGSCMDRFLRAVPEGSTPPALLQLLALTCISLAAKMEQQQAAEELVTLARDERGQFYKAQDVTRMENHVLNTLAFRLRLPNVYTFLRLFLHRVINCPDGDGSPVVPAGSEEAYYNVALNVAELALMDHQLSGVSYSTVAVASMLVAETAVKGGDASTRYRTVEALRGLGPQLPLAHLSGAVQRLYGLYRDAAMAGSA